MSPYLDNARGGAPDLLLNRGHWKRLYVLVKSYTDLPVVLG